MVVAPIYAKDIQETYTLREVLDVLAIKLFLEQATKSMKLDMEDTVEAMEKSYKEHNFEAIIQADKAFHIAYSSNTGNKQLETMLSILRDQANRMLYHAKMDEKRISRSIREHREIMEAVKNDDITKAQDAMYQHMSGLREYHLENTPNTVIKC
jgi:DNA-binding GntR family transcriptional regulator